jgi:hypothetical protein
MRAELSKLSTLSNLFKVLNSAHYDQVLLSACGVFC